jgi:hypothetical protein
MDNPHVSVIAVDAGENSPVVLTNGDRARQKDDSEDD